MSKHKWNRAEVDNLLLRYEATLKRIRILAPGRASHTWRVEMDAKELYAVSLVRSSDYWKHRLHLTAKHVSMVICVQHDTILPVPCLALLEGWSYEAHKEPRTFQARNRYTSYVVIGALLCGLESWFQGVQALPTGTKYRYLARIQEYSRRRPGRPLEA